MTQKSTASPTPDTMVPIANNEARVYQLAYYKPDQTEGVEDAKGTIRVHPTHKARLLPGLNYVSLGVLKACGISVESDSSISGLRGKLAIVDVSSMMEFVAVELARNTTSQTALRRWAETEVRPLVLQAIRDRLKSSDLVD